jgi:hypothetical protein
LKEIKERLKKVEEERYSLMMSIKGKDVKI